MDPLALIQKYYDAESPLYETLVTHSRQVSDKAISIARNNPHLDIDLQFVQEAAMLHDIGIFQTNAPRIFCNGKFPYIAHGYLGADILRAEGFEKHALVCERHTGTGLSLKQIERNALPIPHRDMQPVSIEEQLICFADKFYSKTHLDGELPIEKIRAKMLRFGEDSLAKFDYWMTFFNV